MIDFQDLLQKLLLAGALLGALLAVLKYLADIYKILKPFLGPVVLWGSILVPHGMIIWYWMYLAAVNSSRIREGQVFIWLIIQLTFLTSLYTFLWGKWLYPKLKRWAKSQSNGVKSSTHQGKHGQKGEYMPPPDIYE